MLAIDSSTPAYVSTLNTAVTNLTSASFTPPVGSLLAVVYSNGDGAHGILAPVNTGGAVTWNGAAKVSEAANTAAAAIWLGTVTTSAAMTVKVTLAASASDFDWGFGVVVITGQAATQNGGTQVATSTSGTPSGTIASLVGANSLIVGCVGNFSNATVGTPGTGQSLSFNAHTYSLSDSVQGSSAWAQYLTGMNLAAGASATINDTAPTAIDYSLAMLEILAAGTAAAPKKPTIVMQAVPRAATR